MMDQNKLWYEWLEVSDHMSHARELLRIRMSEALSKGKNRYGLDSDDSGTEYTATAIRELFEKGLYEGNDRRKTGLLLRLIMSQNEARIEIGDFEYIDEYMTLVETTLDLLENSFRS